MLKKKSFCVGTLILGVVLFGLSFAFQGEEVKTIAGALLGMGTGLIGMSFANLLMKRWEQKNPGLSKQNEIEYNDERSMVIRHKAKAKAGDITQWFIMGIAYLILIINGTLWMIMLTVGVFVLYNLLGAYFVYRYQKEM